MAPRYIVRRYCRTTDLTAQPLQAGVGAGLLDDGALVVVVADLPGHRGGLDADPLR